VTICSVSFTEKMRLGTVGEETLRWGGGQRIAELEEVSLRGRGSDQGVDTQQLQY